MKNYRYVFFLVALVLAAFPLNALSTETAPFWFKLERGKHLFYAGNYGEALALFQEARNERIQRYEDHRAAVLALLSHPEVRGLEDNLDRVLDFASKRYFTAAEAAFNELFFRIPRERLEGRASASLDMFDRLKAYAEAEFWIGEVYRVEGAASIAVKQYEKALSIGFDEPSMEIDLLYRLASLHQSAGNYPEMERRLLEILNTDPLWSRDASNFTKTAIQRTFDSDGSDRVLLMYRHKSPVAERAHRLLGEYYYQSGRHQRAAEHYLFAWLSTSTTIIEAYQQPLVEPFEFKRMTDVTRNLARRKDISAWMDEVEYYKTCYFLGDSLFRAGKETAARSIWAYLASEEAAGEWRTRARTPVLEGRAQ